MKKLLIIVSLLISLLLLSSCAKKNEIMPSNVIPSEVNKPAFQETKLPLTINDYYPFNKNTRYEYAGQGNEYASYHVFIDYVTGNRIQIRSNNGGTETVKVLENSNGELIQLFSRGECYYRENLTQTPDSNMEILLKEPLIKGTTWTLADSSKRYISNVEVAVTTPLGNYKTLEVTTEGPEGKSLDYYAPDVGLVKSVFTFKGVEISSTLSKLKSNVPLTQTVKFYYPNATDSKLYIVNKQLTFNTNDITKAIFEKAFKEIPNKDLSKVLGPNVKIKSLYLNQDNMVYVDFSKELVNEMNAGSGYEGMILQSITNTLGTYYGVDKVYLTVEGNPYSSGHIMLKKGEFFTVNIKNSVETN